MVFQNAPNSGESQASAFAGLFGREKRFKDFLQHFRRDAHPGVSHGDDHARAGFDLGMPARVRFLDLAVSGAQHQHAAAGHGITGIDAKVEQHLMDLRCVAANDPKLRVHVFLESDVFGKGFAHHRFNVAEQVFELDDFILPFGAPGEGENLTDQLGATPHAATQCVEQILVFGAGEAVA